MPFKAGGCVNEFMKGGGGDAFQVVVLDDMFTCGGRVCGMGRERENIGRVREEGLPEGGQGTREGGRSGSRRWGQGAMKRGVME